MATPADLRSAFKNRMNQGIPYPPGEFDPQDLERVNDDIYLNRVLDHHDGNLKKATNMLWDIMVWRKTVEANQINETNIRMDYLKEGIFFPRGRDIHGGVIFIAKWKLYVKSQKNDNDLKRIIIYWLDRIDREENGEGKVSLFLDTEGCGIENVTLELSKYLTDAFDKYYPNFLNYIIVFQMPWILTAICTMIKSLLTAKGKAMIKPLTKDNLKTLVPLDQALTCWGGRDPYTFRFVPENTDYKKTLCAEDYYYSSAGKMIRLSPHDTIIFNINNDEITGHFKITNTHENAISFKIRTTYPDKFFLCPSIGILPSGSVQTVYISVQPGFQQNTAAKDGFLISSIQLPKPDLTLAELANAWQNTSLTNVEEYRLKYKFPQIQILNGNVSNGMGTQASVVNSFSNLQAKYQYESLKRDFARLQKFQFVTLVLAAIAFVLAYLQRWT